MKKVLVLVMFSAVFTACEKNELESAEETVLVERKTKEKDFKKFNAKIIGAKGDEAPQNQQPSSQTEKKES